jgi:hypothetical protein
MFLQPDILFAETGLVLQGKAKRVLSCNDWNLKQDSRVNGLSASMGTDKIFMGTDKIIRDNSN